MQRKIYQQMKEWKETGKGTTALLIDGARRVGKSYTVEEFAKKEYRSYILIDFNRVEEAVKDLFHRYLNDLDQLFLYLSGYFNTKLYERESLIIFDEVQLFPRARAAIKYLVADGRYDYIETGSLMSIKKNVQDIVIPSEEHHMPMYPMDFEEFLWAMGNEPLMRYIQDTFDKKRPMGDLLHRKAMDYFRQYLIVGGMPQAVKAYVESRYDFEQVDRIKRDILHLYRADISKYARGYEMKVVSIFDEIPSQLQKHEKKFKLSSLKKGARFRDYEDAWTWLQDAMIVNVAYNSTEPNIGLKLNLDRLTLKCYMGDTGLLISHSFDENGIVSEDIYKKLLFHKLSFNEGMIMENVVAQMLTAAGHKLYFYSHSSADKNQRMEIDFLIAKSKITTRHNISLIEVKSGKNYTLSSLQKGKERYADYIDQCYVLHTGDLKTEDGVIYLPLYMTMML